MGPTRNFHEKYRKNSPQAEILEPQENTPKIPKKIPKTVIFGILGAFFRYFRGIFRGNSGSPEFQAGGYFLGIFRGKSRVGPSRGSVAGGGVLKGSSSSQH